MRNLLHSGSDIYHIRTDMWVFIQKKPEAGLHRTLRHDREPPSERPLFMVFWVKDQPGRQGARAASFPSWGSARRHVRVRKELSLGVGNSPRSSHLAQLGRARNLLKPVTSSEAFTFPHGPRAHLHQSRHNASADPSTLSKPANVFLSVNPNPTRKTWLRTRSQTKLLGWLSPKGLSHLQHLKHLHCLAYLLLLQRRVSSPGAATSWRNRPLLELLFLKPMGRPTVRGIIRAF